MQPTTKKKKQNQRKPNANNAKQYVRTCDNNANKGDAAEGQRNDDGAATAKKATAARQGPGAGGGGRCARVVKE